MEFKKTKVYSNINIKENVFSLKVHETNPSVLPGQFYMLKLDYPLLPRPISVCKIEKDILEFCYITVGIGTEKLSTLRSGDDILITGPIGNGFDVQAIRQYPKVALVSGGIGIAPFVELAAQLDNEVSVFCGFSGFSYLTERFDHVVVSTDDGSEGIRGFVTDTFEAADFDLVIGCGSEPFLKALVAKCKTAGTPSLISMDKHMACGVGACLVCACKTIHGNKRCCVDGPIFYGDELIL